MTVHTIGGQVGHVTKHPATHFQVGRVRSAWITCQVWQQWMKLNMNFYQHPVWDTESLAHTWHPVERSTHSVTGTDSVSILDDFFWWDASCREHVNSVNLWASHQRENQPSNIAFTRMFPHLSWLFRWISVSLLPGKQQWPETDRQKYINPLYHFSHDIRI